MPIRDEQSILLGSDLSLSYNNSQVLDCVSLDIKRGHITTLVGPNGSGKTSLIKILLEMIKPDSGYVYRQSGIRIGYVPQFVKIDPTLPLTVQRFVSLGGRNPLNEIEKIFTEVGANHIKDKPFQSLSGGERRRVLLARALLNKPDLLVLDEPAAGVDVTGQIALYRLIADIRDRRGVGVLLVSHNLHLVMAATDHVICLNCHICCEGRPATISRAPEFLEIFGREATDALALYAHHHDHNHDDGVGVPLSAHEKNAG